MVIRMAFDVKYHILAESELKQRKQSNAKQLRLRRSEIERRFPEFAKLRAVMASTGAKIVAIALKGGDAESVETKLREIQQENANAATRIKELLVKAKYPADYLNTFYSCKTCRDTGVAGYSRCDCYKNIVKRLAAEGINSKSPLTLTGFESFDVELYPNVEEDECNVREIMRDNFNYCKDYADEFRLPNAGLLLSGKTGLGKTHLSLAIAGRVLSNGFNAVYGSAPDLFRRIEGEHFGREKGNTMDSLQSAELLVLDDIGAEFESGFYTSMFYNLINSRMNSGNPTVINTNMTMGELRQRYGDRITSRFLTMKILKFYGNDIRQIKRGSAQSQTRDKLK
ncbi:MAG: ATP-binding protein [Oscillospiraceae bacterium]|nr:ATP-binding protein [Oscillospiraceae bacterium]